MLDLEHMNRPSVEDLSNIPQVTMKIKEKRLQENFKLIKKREDELIDRE